MYEISRMKCCYESKKMGKIFKKLVFFFFLTSAYSLSNSKVWIFSKVKLKQIKTKIFYFEYVQKLKIKYKPVLG